MALSATLAICANYHTLFIFNTINHNLYLWTGRNPSFRSRRKPEHPEKTCESEHGLETKCT